MVFGLIKVSCFILKCQTRNQKLTVKHVRHPALMAVLQPGVIPLNRRCRGAFITFLDTPEAPQCTCLSIRSITNLPYNLNKKGRTSKDNLVQPLLMGKEAKMRLSSTLFKHLLKISSCGGHCSRDCLTTKLTALKILLKRFYLDTVQP